MPRYPRYSPNHAEPNRLNLHLVSDATGETLNSIARATVSQFERCRIIYHRWSLIRTRFQLHRVLEGIEAEPGPVLSTLLDKGLRDELETRLPAARLTVVNVLDPVLGMLQEQIGEQAQSRPGRQYVLDADYFRRIDAMHFVLAHDDGQAQAGIAEADVMLVGRVAQLSKTPTSFYLANRGVKAANVPLVPGLPDPPGLAEPRCPVIGLTLDPQALIEIRRHRLRMIAHGGSGRMRQDTQRLCGRGRGEGRVALGTAAVQPPRLAGDRRDPPFDRGDGGNRAATDGGVARPASRTARRRRRDACPAAPRLVLASGSARAARCWRRPGWRSRRCRPRVDEAAVKAAMRAEGDRCRRCRAGCWPS